MNVSTFYGRKKTHINIKEISYNGSDDSDLASDSENEETIISTRSQTNVVIPESDYSESDEEIQPVINTQIQESEEDMPQDENGEDNSRCQVRAIGTGSRPVNKLRPVWNDIRQPIIRKIPPWKGNYTTENTQSPESPISYFKRIIDNDMVANIMEQTNLYSVQKNTEKPVQITSNEVEQFIGSLFFMSIYGLPRTEMFWRTETRVAQVADIMSRNRWQTIKNNLHFIDNNSMVGNTDKLFKLRPFLDSFARNLHQIPIEEKVCVDEQIIPFKGKHSLKVYMQNKPKKWGYKVFALCDSSGVILNFEPYTGKIEHDIDLPDVGISGNIVLRLTKILARHINHKVYYDNWFSSVSLLVELEKMGIQSLGTVRPNRLPGCNFSSDKAMKQQGRGALEEKIANVEDIRVLAIKWYDNKPVHLLSSFAGAYPTSAVRRWDKKEKKNVEVQCPSAVMIYNKFMGGVDLMDSLIALYRINIRSKKWYHRIFFHFLDMAVVNSWLLYRKDCQACAINKKEQLSLLQFKANLAACLCQQGKPETRKRGRPSLSTMQMDIDAKKKKPNSAPLPVEEVRRDQIGHWPTFTEKRGRCRKPHCAGVPKVMCVKCRVHLCFTPTSNCFTDFHK